MFRKERGLVGDWAWKKRRGNGARVAGGSRPVGLPPCDTVFVYAPPTCLTNFPTSSPSPATSLLDVANSHDDLLIFHFDHKHSFPI